MENLIAMYNAKSLHRLRERSFGLEEMLKSAALADAFSAVNASMFSLFSSGGAVSLKISTIACYISQL